MIRYDYNKDNIIKKMYIVIQYKIISRSCINTQYGKNDFAGDLKFCKSENFY